MQFKDDNLIFPCAQQRRGDVERIAGADVPVTADVEAVDPDHALDAREFEEGLGRLGDIEAAAMEGRPVLFRRKRSVNVPLRSSSSRFHTSKLLSICQVMPTPSGSPLQSRPTSGP